MEICAVGGYNEVGKNMTCIKVGNDVVVLDMGIHLENYIKFAEDEDIVSLKSDDLIKVGAVPDVNKINDWSDKVRAIIPTHAHLDHLGGIPFLSNRYNAEILGSPFSIAVLEKTLDDEKMKLKNKRKVIQPNASYNMGNMKVEFINITHSTPQTVMVALHTKEGIILYANDFKFDNYPTLGTKPNINRLKELGQKGITALICDSTYAREAKKMPSESVAKEMLRDVMLGIDCDKKAMIVTTFSSHIARLSSIIEFGKKLNRKVVFLGRSLSKYVYAAESVGLVHFSKEVEIVKYAKKIKKRLNEIQKEGKHKYLLVVTGHQGEPQSTLSKMVDRKFDFRFNEGDNVIFSCKVIPTPTNIANRDYIERNLSEDGVRIFKDIHQSGHAAREDLRDLISYVKPKNIIPAHGNVDMTLAMSSLAQEMGYTAYKTVHILQNGARIVL